MIAHFIIIKLSNSELYSSFYSKMWYINPYFVTAYKLLAYLLFFYYYRCVYIYIAPEISFFFLVKFLSINLKSFTLWIMTWTTFHMFINNEKRKFTLFSFQTQVYIKNMKTKLLFGTAFFHSNLRLHIKSHVKAIITLFKYTKINFVCFGKFRSPFLCNWSCFFVRQHTQFH